MPKAPKIKVSAVAAPKKEDAPNFYLTYPEYIKNGPSGYSVVKLAQVVLKQYKEVEAKLQEGSDVSLLVEKQNLLAFMAGMYPALRSMEQHDAHLAFVEFRYDDFIVYFEKAVNAHL